MRTQNHPLEQEELMAYLDGELPRDKSAEISAHLEECGECRTLAATFGDVSHSMSEWKVEEANFQAKYVGAGAPRRIWFPFAWRPGLAVLAGAVVLVLIAFVSTRHWPPERPMYDGAMWAAPDAKPDATKSAAAQKLLQQSPIPMIARTAELRVSTTDFDGIREAIVAIAKRHGGYVAAMTLYGVQANARNMNATVSVPADQLEATISELAKTGHVLEESRNGLEVTEEYVDLQARLTNARNTEQGLRQLERRVAGKLSEVLSVETEIARVRGEIERMEAEDKNLTGRVRFSSIHIRVSEDYKAQLQMIPPSIGARLRNAAVEGYRNLIEGLVTLGVALLSQGPSILLWLAILLWPVRLVIQNLMRRTYSLVKK